MSNFIIKKDGSKEPFDIQKIKNAIVTAGEQAGLTVEEGKKIAEEVSDTIARSIANLNEVLGAEIRARALSQLDAISPAVAGAWRRYDEENNKN